MSNAIAPEPRLSRRFRLRRCAFRFDGRTHCVKAARTWLDARMKVAGVPPETADTAALLLSELATNAVLHTPSGDVGGRFAVRAYFLPGRLRVEVRDEGGLLSPLPPTASAPDPDAEHGRGLLLVATLAQRWGRFTSGRGPGMYFELRWAAAPAASALPRREEVRP
ncbi:hypothetical protein LP52_09645 [Streptomonospora alba]|uniref:Histidine kinase/HSP90-like ATPase domain-containing protein n=1 Tax=Streptomonospora alba TaxID=183763 RepID=A0A0C2FIJ4_9ACTN|nr:ATP-binding protein [Streptomonospora alba]KIH99099.1 hypothetical protein LP52_09645 [Streptomonospora alba]